MTEEQTISWIFLSIALASQTKSTDLKEISVVADGINHSILNQNQLQKSISWLLKKLLICEFEKKYKLTNLGISEYQKANQNTKVLIKIWKNLELKIGNMNENNLVK